MGLNATTIAHNSKMKTPFILLLGIVASVYGQAFPECRCGFFVTFFTTEIEIHRLPAINLASCDEVDECVVACRAEADKLSGHGDLHYELSNGYSVGQELCIGALTFFMPQVNDIVHGYANVCHGPWMYTGFSCKQKLCCHFGRHYECSTAPPPLA